MAMDLYEGDLVGTDYAEFDDRLVCLFSSGKSDIAIADELESEGYDDVSCGDIKQRRIELNDRVIAYISENPDEIFATIPRVHKPFRVRELSEAASVMVDGIQACSANGKWNHAAKLAETLLKINKQIAEDTSSFGVVEESSNQYVQLIQNAPPEMRDEIKAQMREHLELMRKAAGA